MSDWGPNPDWPTDVPEGNPSGGGRHRAETNPRSRAASRIIAPLLAVAVVAAAVGVLIAIRGHSSGSGPGPGVIVAPTTTPVATPTHTPRGSTTPTPSVALTHPAPTPSSTRKAAHHQPPAWRTAMASVRVYNSTHITGLAHRVASEIAAKGWTVPDVGNVTGAASQTTLYYGPHSKDAARHLAHEFSGIRQIRPNSAQQLGYHGLTLVLTADWHD